MVRSMTGFGKASCTYNNDAVTMELSAVNHRYLDAVIRLPSEWSSLDHALRETLQEGISRGKVNVSVTRKRADGGAQRLKLDRGLAEQYIEISKELAALIGSAEPLSVQTLAQFDGIYTHEEEAEDLEAASAMLRTLLAEGVATLNAMRENEGRALARDLLDRLLAIRASLSQIEERLPVLNELHAERLRSRIRDLAQDSGLAEDRIALEVALSAERGDVTEEVVRLKSHLDHAEELLGVDEPVGRKLNFLSQEVQREINTLGAKVRDTEVVRNVLDMKSELERIREQIQNIE